MINVAECDMYDSAFEDWKYVTKRKRISMSVPKAEDKKGNDDWMFEFLIVNTHSYIF